MNKTGILECKMETYLVVKNFLTEFLSEKKPHPRTINTEWWAGQEAFRLFISHTCFDVKKNSWLAEFLYRNSEGLQVPLRKRSCSVHCALCTVQYALCIVHCAVCSVQCALCNSSCSVGKSPAILYQCICVGKRIFPGALVLVCSF